MEMNFYQKTTLDNGLRIVTSAMPYARSVAVNVFIGVGSRYESETQAGRSHFIEHMVFRGTQKRPTAQDISAAIEGVGGTINAATDKELTIYWCKVAQRHFLLALDVLTDMLLHCRIEPEDTEKERQIIIEEINQSRDSPPQEVEMLSDELLWPGHPLGRDIAGTKESVSKITRNSLVNFMSKHYLPANTVIAVAGNIQHEAVVAAISEMMGNWTAKKDHHGFMPFNGQPVKQVSIEKRDTDQVHLCLAMPGLSIVHRDRFTLDLLNSILGQGMSSRLFTEIRDKLGLAYSISSAADHFLDTGSISIYAGTEVRHLNVIVTAVLKQIEELKKPVTEAELLKAKGQAEGRLMLRMEESQSIAGWIGAQEVLMGSILSVDEVIKIINAITAEDLQRVAAELFSGRGLTLAVVGPVSEQESLEQILRL